MYFNKRLILFFIFFITILNSSAQNTTDVFKGDDWSHVNADNFTDANVANLRQSLQTNGISIAQAEQIALSKGMPKVEWEKLKNKLIQYSSKPGGQQKNGVTEPSIITQPERQPPDNDYRVYQKLPSSNVFGSDLFNSPSLSFEPNLRIATPANYILGPDDELLITVSGYQEAYVRVGVDPEGRVFIPQVGQINVAGLSVDEVTNRIRDKMGQTAYRSLKSNLSKIVVSLAKVRSIQITIIGAAKPGNYTVSSLSTVFNSLYQCGGPGAINTYRDIELIRNNKVYQKIDIYRFLTRGDQKGNVLLHENDVINFPVYKKRVVIHGQVKRAGVFEMKDGETLDDLLFFAGGFTENAYKASIKVKQITDTVRKVKDISKPQIATYQPANGDSFEVDSVLERFDNSIIIVGAIYRPGEFELTPGITISGLIKRAGGLQENAFTDRAVLTRTYANGVKENITFNVKDVMNGGAGDVKLIKGDSVSIVTTTQFQSKYTITIKGEVRKPGDYPFKENLSLKDMLFLSGGFTDAGSTLQIEIGRRITTDRPTRNIDSIAQVFNVTVEKNLTIENDKFILMPFDIITVRRNPGYTEQRRVKINGEVNYPGTYTVRFKNEHISDLIKRAGGLTQQANLNGIFLIRNAADSSDITKQNVRNIQKSINDTSSKVIEDVVRHNTRIAINGHKVIDAPGSTADYVLQDGDSLQVLKTDPLVKLSGEVLSTTKTGFVAGKTMRYYLNQAGGTNDNARPSKIYVLYANGQIARTNNGIWGLFRSYPRVEAGSEIIVPRKLQGKHLTTSESIGLTTALVSLASLIIVTISVLHK